MSSITHCLALGFSATAVSEFISGNAESVFLLLYIQKWVCATARCTNQFCCIPPAIRKSIRPGLVSGAIKLLKPVTHIPRLAVTP